MQALDAHDANEVAIENKIVAKTGCFVIYCDLPIPAFKDFPLNSGFAIWYSTACSFYVDRKKDIYCSCLIFWHARIDFGICLCADDLRDSELIILIRKHTLFCCECSTDKTRFTQFKSNDSHINKYAIKSMIYDRCETFSTKSVSLCMEIDLYYTDRKVLLLSYCLTGVTRHSTDLFAASIYLFWFFCHWDGVKKSWKHSAENVDALTTASHRFHRQVLQLATRR